MMEIKLLPFKGNEETYREFVLRHEDDVFYNDTVPNTTQIVEWAKGSRKADNIIYGEFRHFPEEVIVDLLDMKGFRCDLMPPTELAVACGVSHEGQTDCYLRLFDDADAERHEIRSLLNGSLDW